MAEYQPYIMVAIGLVSSGVLAWAWKTSKKAIRILQELHAILTPNGGASMADKVNALIEVSGQQIEEQALNRERWEAIDLRLKTVEQGQEDLRTGQLSVVGRLDKVDRRMASGERRFEKVEAAQAALMQQGEAVRTPSARPSPGEE